MSLPEDLNIADIFYKSQELDKLKPKKERRVSAAVDEN